MTSTCRRFLKTALSVALGEQEYSMHRWECCIANRAMDIAQPDMQYGGSFLRSTQVARMAAAAGMEVVHFASFTPNTGPCMEFKGSTDRPVACDTPPLKCEKGFVRGPGGPGFGVTIDPDFVKKAQRRETPVTNPFSNP
jgi:L-alanine-DL-glutamate epimerase-like enolase superfamily enzyme